MICKQGVPDTEQYTAHREPGASVTRQAELTQMVLSTYKRHNAQAFNVIYNRLNLSKRPQVEWWILEHFLPTFDGHALYQYVLKSADCSQGTAKASGRRSWSGATRR